LRLFLVLQSLTLCPHGPLQLDKVSLDLLRCAGINRTPDVLHQVDNRLRFIERHAAKVNCADFQGALAAVHRRLKQLASDPDLAVTSAFVKLVTEPLFYRVPAAVEMPGDDLDGAPNHRHLAHQIAVDFLERPSTSVFRHSYN